MSAAEELPVREEELEDARRELDAARTGAQRGRRAWDRAEDLTGGWGQPPGTAAAAALERAKAFGEFESDLADALAEARALLEQTDGYEHPLRDILAEAVEEATTEEPKAAPTTQAPHHWLRSGRDLLEQPDPGPIDWLVEELLVEQALGAIQGHYKAGKSWLVLELGAAIVTGRDALGRFTVPTPGPVIMVLEESPERETHRRLDQLRRAYNLPSEALADLHLASNQGVRLDPGSEWRERLIEAARAIRPRAVFLDPLVRIKGGEVDENVQREIVAVLDHISDLRREAECAVIYAHHVGHRETTRMRGSSDLEAFWSSKVVVEGERNPRKIHALHRDAAPSEEYGWNLRWHEQSETMRVEVAEGPSTSQRLHEKLLARVGVHPGESANNVAKAIGGRKQKVLDGLRELADRGLLEEHDGGWYVPSTGGSHPREPVGTGGGSHPREPVGTGTATFGSTERKQAVPTHGNHPEPRAQEGGSRGSSPPTGGNREPSGPARREGTVCENGGQVDHVDTVEAVLARFPGTREESAP